MSLIRKVARPLLGASFIANGVDRLRNSEESAEKIQPTLDEVSALVPQADGLVSNPVLTTKVLGGVEVAAGLALAIGKFPRLASFTLSGVHILDSYNSFRTAPLEEPSDVDIQRATALKNVTILGGLWLAAVDLAGKPSLSWRAENLSKQAKKKGLKFRDKTVKFAEDLGDDAVKTAKSLEKDAKKQFSKAEKDAVKLISQASREAKKTAKNVG